jgi:hypothetical protein
VSRRGPLAAFAAFGILWGGWAALVPAVQDAVGATKGELGLAFLFVAVGSVPAMLLAGRELDRRGTRILPWLLAGGAAATVLPAFAGSVGALAAALLVLGLLFRELVTLMVGVLVTILFAIPVAAVATRLEGYRIPRAIGALLAILLILGSLAGVVAAVMPTFIDQADQFIDDVPEIVEDLEREVDRLREDGVRFRNEIVTGPGGKSGQALEL